MSRSVIYAVIETEEEDVQSGKLHPWTLCVSRPGHLTLESKLIVLSIVDIGSLRCCSSANRRHFCIL